jgi:hypothetical protein
LAIYRANILCRDLTVYNSRHPKQEAFWRNSSPTTYTGTYYNSELVAAPSDQARVGNKKPAQKNPPKKTRLKKPTSKRVFFGFYWVLLGFFKIDICFWWKSHYFSVKCLWKSLNLGCTGN